MGQGEAEKRRGRKVDGMARKRAFETRTIQGQKSESKQASLRASKEKNHETVQSREIQDEDKSAQTGATPGTHPTHTPDTTKT